MRKVINQLLKFLLEKNDYVTIQQISDEFTWSKRTARKYLDDLDEELKSLSLPQITRAPRKGLVLTAEDKKVIQNSYLNELSITYESNFLYSEERQLYILWGILCTSEVIKIDSLVDKLGFSRSSVNSDIRGLKQKLSESGLTLESNKEKGFFVIGDEFRIRILLLKLLREQTDGDFGHFNGNEKIQILSNEYNSHLSAVNLDDFIDDLETILPESYSLESQSTLRLYLLLIIFRSRFYKPTPSEKMAAEESELNEGSFYELSKLILIRLNEECKIVNNSFEIFMLTTLMLTLPSNEDLNFQSNNPIELDVMTYKIIDFVSKVQNYPFYEDQELHSIILSHLGPAIHRIEFDLQIKNPLLDMIVEKYHKLNQTVKSALEIIEKATNKSVTLDEASFFTLYFASSMEKLGSKVSSKINVVLVCNSGNAISRLLQYKLLNNFYVTVTNVTSEQKLYEILGKEKLIDLVISVVPLKNELMGEIDFIQISPLLLEKDMNKLEKVLPKKKEGLFNEEPIIECKEELHLLDLLTKDRFLVDQDLSSLKDLVIVSGNLLSETGCTDDHYTTEMLNVIYHFNSLGHINIAPGIILPHSGISGSVKKPGISFVRCKESFKYMGDTVDCAFAMCTTNRTVHSKAIRELGSLISNEKFQRDLRNISSYEEFDLIVKKNLEK